MNEKVDGFFINTDEMEYGGKFTDLKQCTKAVKNIKPSNPPPCILKDIIIHPVQVRTQFYHFIMVIKNLYTFRV